jgi:hypothetical protein
MSARHPLLSPETIRQIDRAASLHLGRRWVSQGFTDLNDQASHPAGIHHGRPFSVFAKLSVAADRRAQFAAELSGLHLIRLRTPVATPAPLTCSPDTTKSHRSTRASSSAGRCGASSPIWR